MITTNIKDTSLLSDADLGYVTTTTTNSPTYNPMQFSGATSMSGWSVACDFTNEVKRKKEVLEKMAKLQKIKEQIVYLTNYSKKNKLNTWEVIEAFLSEEELDIYEDRLEIEAEFEDLTEEDKKKKEETESISTYIDPNIEQLYLAKKDILDGRLLYHNV